MYCRLQVTGFVVFYRLNALETLGKLLPNLARIRGQEVLHNYALIIHDMNSLKEVSIAPKYIIKLGAY